jgi:hypothetical protein
MNHNNGLNRSSKTAGLGLAWARAGTAGALVALAASSCVAADPSDDLSDEPLGTHAEEIRAGTEGGGITGSASERSLTQRG